MGCHSSRKLISSHNKLRKNLTISLLLLLITQLTFTAEGRRHIKTKKALFLQPIDSAKTTASSVNDDSEDNKAILRGLIGSRPPRCERRCTSCVHCEAIQVPANPQVKQPKKSDTSKNSPTTTTSATTTTKVFTDAAYFSRGEYSSNYKPMSWKCKCGNYIFNP